jgi:hypothetical protein
MTEMQTADDEMQTAEHAARYFLCALSPLCG